MPGTSVAAGGASAAVRTKRFTAVEAVKKARPIWAEVTLSCDFEAETLPLLFASDADFNAYYDAMEALHHRKARLIRHVRDANVEARKCRAEGDWAACIAELEHACEERQAVFARDDYQCVAARLHLAWTAVHAATILAVSHNDDQLAAAHSLFALARSHVNFAFKRAPPDELSAAEAAEAVRGRRWLHQRTLLVLHNNWANYWATRGRWGAAMQHSEIAARLANTLMPHVPCAAVDPLTVPARVLQPGASDEEAAIVGRGSPLPPASPTSAMDAGAEEEEEMVAIPPPPPGLFSKAAAPAHENPAPLVLLCEARRLVCTAWQRTCGSSALSNFDGLQILKPVKSLVRLTDDVDAAAPAEPAPVLVLPLDANAGGGSGGGGSGNSPSGGASSHGGPPSAWTVLCSEPSALHWTLATSAALHHSPFPSALATAALLSNATAAFLLLHLRDVDAARGHSDRCQDLLDSLAAGPATSDKLPPPEEPREGDSNTANDDAAASPVVPTNAVPDVPPAETNSADDNNKPAEGEGAAVANDDSKASAEVAQSPEMVTVVSRPGSPSGMSMRPTTGWWGRVRELQRCVAVAGDVSKVAARKMPPDATRHAAGLAAAKLVRDDMLAQRAAAERERREATWLQWAVQEDESGLLDDDVVDVSRRRELFHLPQTKAEGRTLGRRLARATASTAATPATRSRATTPAALGAEDGDGAKPATSPSKGRPLERLADVDLSTLSAAALQAAQDAPPPVVTPPFERATTPFGAVRSKRALTPVVSLSTASDLYLRAATPNAGRGGSRLSRPNTSAASGASGASAPGVDSAPPAPSSVNLGPSGAATANHASGLSTASSSKLRKAVDPELKAKHARRRELRAVLPTLDVLSVAYREVVRELSAIEASMREARDAAAREKLLRDAGEIAARAGITAQWRKSGKRLAAEANVSFPASVVASQRASPAGSPKLPAV